MINAVLNEDAKMICIPNKSTIKSQPSVARRRFFTLHCDFDSDELKHEQTIWRKVLGDPATTPTGTSHSRFIGISMELNSPLHFVQFYA